ncbi:hypothetical protein ACIPRM_26115 [Streptomyces anulatus]|uniref:hypothetical protein n=1 Tax=Streptomyces anulatus TaxID=1892 RepID=UPI003824EE9F
MRQIEQAAEDRDATFGAVLGVLTWHLTESAAFIGLLHADRASTRPGIRAHALALSERVEHALRTQEDLVGSLRDLGGTPPEVLDEPELLDYLTGILCRDAGT